MIKLTSVPKPFPQFVTQRRCTGNKCPIMRSITDHVPCNFESILCPAMLWPADIPEALAKQSQPLVSSQCALP